VENQWNIPTSILPPCPFGWEKVYTLKD